MADLIVASVFPFKTGTVRKLLVNKTMMIVSNNQACLFIDQNCILELLEDRAFS
jgi:hypothetical protein